MAFLPVSSSDTYKHPQHQSLKQLNPFSIWRVPLGSRGRALPCSVQGPGWREMAAGQAQPWWPRCKGPASAWARAAIWWGKTRVERDSTGQKPPYSLSMTHAYTELLAWQCDTLRLCVQHRGAPGAPATGGKEQEEATGAAGALSHCAFSFAHLRCLPACFDIVETIPWLIKCLHKNVKILFSSLMCLPSLRKKTAAAVRWSV